jgi:aryl-alcohol dehydrogenase-like predicted oxidoreductase
MKTLKLGSSGLEISAICLGCMSFGQPDRGPYPWTLPEEAALPILKRALDFGINFLDTANSYSDGTSEEIIGKFIGQSFRRDELVIATKVYFPDKPGPNRGGLSRKAIFREIDQSLRRLQTDYIDLYQIHRWDYETPIEETLEALHDIVRAGKVRYIGASSMYAWQFSKAIYTQRIHGWTQFISMQNHLNLLYREEEREMLPLCEDMGIGVLAWSPLARGRLTRPAGVGSKRIASDSYGLELYSGTEAVDNLVIDAVKKVASQRGVTSSEVAMAWVMRKVSKGAPILGVNKIEHLNAAIAALSLELEPEEIHILEQPYVPHRIAGYL